MGQFSKVLLAIDNACTAPQRALDCGPGLWAQPSHSLCLDYLWQVYQHLYQMYNYTYLY